MAVGGAVCGRVEGLSEAPERTHGSDLWVTRWGRTGWEWGRCSVLSSSMTRFRAGQSSWKAELPGPARGGWRGRISGALSESDGGGKG